jgi:hypothetical protein
MVQHGDLRSGLCGCSKMCVQVPIDFTDPNIQQQMDTSLELFQENDYVVGDTIRSWWLDFRRWNNGTVARVCLRCMLVFHWCLSALPQCMCLRCRTCEHGLVMQNTFYEDLELFLNSAGGRYKGDIVFKTEGVSTSGIKTARSDFQWRYFEGTQDQVQQPALMPHGLHLCLMCTDHRLGANPSMSVHVFCAATIGIAENVSENDVAISHLDPTGSHTCMAHVIA